MDNKYIVHVFLDKQCDIEALTFKHIGQTQTIINQVEKLCSNWEVIVVSELFYNEYATSNFWIKSEL